MNQFPLNYGRHWLDDDDLKCVIDVLRGDWLTQGPTIEKFERALAEYCGARYAVAVANGTVALHLACLAAGLGSGDEGITSPISFAASANCMFYCGAKPVFTDIEPDTWNIDHVAIEKRINSRTKVIIPVHFAGLPCSMESIFQIADKYKLIIIEDACHALGAKYQNHHIGACQYSQMTVFSFHPVKAITTGEGGAILTNDQTLAERLKMLRHHGITKDPRMLLSEHQDPWYYEVQVLGYNARITDMQCALGLSQLRKLPQFIKRRREITERYRERLNKFSGLSFQKENTSSFHAYHLMVIHLDPERYNRRLIFEGLNRRGIFPQVHYVPLHLQPLFRNRLGTGSGDFPMAEAYYAGAISLPCYPRMTDEDVDCVVKSLSEIIESLN